MRQILCLIITVGLFTLSAFGQNEPNKEFILTGKITNARNPIVYLIYDIGEKRIIDSFELKQEYFRFEGIISEPTHAMLRGNSKIMDDSENPNFVDFFLEPTRMTATAKYDHFKDIKITGSKTQLEYEKLQKQYATIDEKSDSLYEKFSKVSSQFISSHPDSYASAFQLMLYKTRWPLDSVKLLFSQFQPEIQNSIYGKKIKETITSIEDNSKGKRAKEFSTIDVNGNPISLSDFKNKFVLLDFWGSWCVPCRESTPHLIELFHKYHSKGGLVIIGVAEEYDKTGDSWKTAIKKDGTGIWYNVLSELNIHKDKDTNNQQSIVNKFGVHVFPTKILIDKTGIIVGRYEGTENEASLDKKLSEIFK